MITNKKITYYHKKLDENKLEKWIKYVLDNVWAFGGKGSSINKGYENANDVNIRIPWELVEKGIPTKALTVQQVNAMLVKDLNTIQVRKIARVERTTIKETFSIGDIIAIGEQPEIEKQKDLKDVEYYNVTSINVNDFGNNPHIHLGGK